MSPGQLPQGRRGAHSATGGGGCSVDKLPQVLAHRVTHVVSLAAVTIIARSP